MSDGISEIGRESNKPDLDEDVSVEGLLADRASGESQASFQRWLKSRRTLAARHTLATPCDASETRRGAAGQVNRHQLAGTS